MEIRFFSTMTIIGSSVPNDDDGFNNGLNYSLVDLTLNGGNGDVVASEKNKPLLTYDPLDQEQASFKCSEKITAVEHNDKTILLGNKSFYGHLLCLSSGCKAASTQPLLPLK